MAEDKKQAYCQECGENVLVTRKGTNHILHFILSVLTLGVWIPIWILSAIKVGGWRCNRCGSKKITNRR